MRLMLTAPVLALWLLIAPPVAAQEAGIAQTIQSQLQAFQADDLARAFSFASPTIKGAFGTASNFGGMVQRAYPMVYRPAEARMLELREVAGGLWQRVQITDQAGAVHLLDYKMIETPEGWQIDAVQVLPAPGIGV